MYNRTMKNPKDDYFYNKTTAQIDAKLHYDILEHQDNMFKWAIIILIIIIFLFRGWIGYWLKFGFTIPSKIDNTKISVENSPIQINYTNEESKEKTFVYNSLINKKKITLIPKASYKLAGTVVAHNHQFLITQGFFDSAALYDLGATWGKLGDKDFYSKHFQSSSAKTEMTGSRILWTEFKTRNAPVSVEYARSHWSHSHIIPANRNIMAALLYIKDWDKVEIEGELVDMEYKNHKGDIYKYRTSMSRDDVEPGGDRGNGSCETIYVTQVKRGKFIYK